MPGIKQILIGLVKRNATKRGPTSSDQWNDSWLEAQNDLSSIASQWNSKLIPLLADLANGTQEAGLDAFVDGLDGKTMFTDADAIITASDNTFFNQIKNRPRTLKEQFGDVYNTLTANRTELLNEIETVKAEVLQDTTNFLKRDGTNVMIGTFKAVGGNAASPGITFANDQNTGLFNPAADELALSINGTERARVSSTGTSFSVGLELSSGDTNIILGDLKIAGVTVIDNARALTATSVETAAFKLTTGATLGFVLKTDAAGVGTWQADIAGVTDHGALTGLSDDDHTIYFLLAGRSGGQTAQGGTGPAEDLTLSSTGAGSKGKIVFGSSVYDEATNRLGIGTTTPVRALEVIGAAAVKTAAINGSKLQFDITSTVNIKSDTEGSGSPLPLRIATSGVDRVEFGEQGLEVLTGDLLVDTGDVDIVSGDLKLAGVSRLTNAGGAVLTTFNMPTGAVDTYVLTTDGSGEGTWQIGGASAVVKSIRTISTDTTVLLTDGTILVNAAGADTIVTLPSAVAASGCRFVVKKIDATTNQLIVSGVSGQTIDGEPTFTTDVQWDFAEFQPDGINWYIVG